MHRRVLQAMCLAVASWAMACARPDAAPVKLQGQAASPAHGAGPLTAADIADARAALEHMYATHFAEGQRDWAPHRREWFVARLAQLVQDDEEAGAAQCGVGFLNFDPLTDAQDSVASYTLGSPKAHGDTVLVPVRIHSGDPSDTSDQNATIAMLRDGGRWQIGNVIHSDWDLVSGLKRSVAELRAAPKVDCSTPAAAAPDSASGDSSRTSSRVLERYRLDLDGDGKPDDLILSSSGPLDGGAMKRVEIRGSRSGNHVLADTVDGWDRAPADFKGTHNLVPSRLVYVADFARAGRLLFLFGPDVGCCFQSLVVYQLTPTGPERYFESEEFRFAISPDPRPGVVSTFAGGGRSEGMGAPPGFKSAGSYDPILAYRLEESIRLDTAATIAVNTREKGGFAGFSSREDIIVVERRDGSRALWDRTHKRLFR